MEHSLLRSIIQLCKLTSVPIYALATYVELAKSIASFNNFTYKFYMCVLTKSALDFSRPN